MQAPRENIASLGINWRPLSQPMAVELAGYFFRSTAGRAGLLVVVRKTAFGALGCGLWQRAFGAVGRDLWQRARVAAAVEF